VPGSGCAGTSRRLPRLATLVAAWMLDDREHSRRDEPRGTDDAARASQLADLDRRARAPYLNGSAGPRRLDCVLASSA